MSPPTTNAALDLFTAVGAPPTVIAIRSDALTSDARSRLDAWIRESGYVVRNLPFPAALADVSIRKNLIATLTGAEDPSLKAWANFLITLMPGEHRVVIARSDINEVRGAIYKIFHEGKACEGARSTFEDPVFRRAYVASNLENHAYLLVAGTGATLVCGMLGSEFVIQHLRIVTQSALADRMLMPEVAPEQFGTVALGAVRDGDIPPSAEAHLFLREAHEVGFGDVLREITARAGCPMLTVRVLPPDASKPGIAPFLLRLDPPFDALRDSVEFCELADLVGMRMLLRRSGQEPPAPIYHMEELAGLVSLFADTKSAN